MADTKNETTRPTDCAPGLSITFGEWCEQLRAISAREPERYGSDAVDNCGADSWWDYYEMGYSPEDAWSEDGSYVE